MSIGGHQSAAGEGAPDRSTDRIRAHRSRSLSGEIMKWWICKDESHLIRFGWIWWDEPAEDIPSWPYD